MNINCLSKTLNLLIYPVEAIYQRQTPQVNFRIKLSQFVQCCLLLSLFISLNANSSFLINGYMGDRNDYELIRNGKTERIGKQLPLKPGDKLSVISDTGELTIIEYDGDREIPHTLTKQKCPVKECPFTVPKTSSVHVRNLLTMMEQWIKNNFSPEKTSSVDLNSKSSGAKILLYGERFDESKLVNYLIVGFDSLSVHWRRGMQPPFRISLSDENGHIIAQETNIIQNNFTLTNLTLAMGNYDLTVENKFSSSSIKLAVVELDKVPLSYSKILQDPIPKKIKNYFATLNLASYPSWLFQALQLADRYDLEIIKENILNDYVPVQKDESQLNSP